MQRFCFLAVMACAPFFGFTTPASAELADGLVSYWNWDDTLADSVGAGNGTYVGDTSETFVPGLFGSAVELDGGSEHIQVNNESLYDFGAAGNGFSISTWTQVGAFDTTWQALIAKGEGSEFRLHRRGSEQNLAFNAGGGGDTPAAGGSINDGEWHHIAAVHYGGAGPLNELWVDGMLVASGGNSTNVADNDQPLMIGENPDAQGREWEGLIEDTAIWGRPLTQDEIMAIHDSGRAGRSLGDLTSSQVIPEPASALLLAGLGLFAVSRRNRRA